MEELDSDDDLKSFLSDYMIYICGLSLPRF